MNLIPSRWLIASTTLLLLIAGGLGCQSTATKADPQLAAELSTIPYPKAAPLGEDLDILVQRKWGHVQLVNRTTDEFEDVQIWLNQQYVSKVQAIDIGADNNVNLSQFVNQHGEQYPAGTLLAPDRRFPILLAELFDPVSGKRHRLLVDLPRKN